MALDPAGYSGPGGPLYGRLCYSSHTLPVLRRAPGPQFEPGLTELGYRFPGGGGGVGQPDHSLVIQNQAAMAAGQQVDPGAAYAEAADQGSRTGSSRDGTAPPSGVSTSDGGGTPQTSNSQERGGATSNGTEASGEDKNNHSHDMDWVRTVLLPNNTPV